MNSLIKVIEQWRTQGLHLLPPEPKRRVVAVFERFDVRPSDQVVQMYSLVGGFEVPDDNNWRLWSLDEIAVSDPYDRPESGVLFSDYLMECWCFRLRPAAHGEMEILLDRFDASKPEVVAPSLAAFFDFYLTRPLSLIDARAASAMYP